MAYSLHYVKTWRHAHNWKYILYYRHKRTEPRPQVTCIENVVKFWRVLFEICERTDRQRDIQSRWSQTWHCYRLRRQSMWWIRFVRSQRQLGSVQLSELYIAGGECCVDVLCRSASSDRCVRASFDDHWNHCCRWRFKRQSVAVLAHRLTSAATPLLALQLRRRRHTPQRRTATVPRDSTTYFRSRDHARRRLQGAGRVVEWSAVWRETRCGRWDSAAAVDACRSTHHQRDWTDVRRRLIDTSASPASSSSPSPSPPAAAAAAVVQLWHGGRWRALAVARPVSTTDGVRTRTRTIMCRLQHVIRLQRQPRWQRDSELDPSSDSRVPCSAAHHHHHRLGCSLHGLPASALCFPAIPGNCGIRQTELLSTDLLARALILTVFQPV